MFTHQSLVTCLSHLPTRSPKKQVKLWIEQRRLHERTSSLITSLGGKPAVTVAQATRLDSLGFSHASLVELRSACESDTTFCQTLRGRGIRSKPLQQKLVKCLRAPPKSVPQPSPATSLNNSNSSSTSTCTSFSSSNFSHSSVTTNSPFSTSNSSHFSLPAIPATSASQQLQPFLPVTSTTAVSPPATSPQAFGGSLQ